MLVVLVPITNLNSALFTCWYKWGYYSQCKKADVSKAEKECDPASVTGKSLISVQLPGTKNKKTSILNLQEARSAEIINPQPYQLLSTCQTTLQFFYHFEAANKKWGTLVYVFKGHIQHPLLACNGTPAGHLINKSPGVAFV